MTAPPLPDNEEARIEALRRYEVLDTAFEKSFDQLTKLASAICQTPITLVSLVDRDRQWFKSANGLDARETPRDISFCGHAILGDDILMVEDATRDERFAENPLVQNDPHIRFYAGAPLITGDGYRIGTLCAIDRKPRKLTAFQQEALKILAGQVIDELELRRSLRQLEENLREKDKMLAMVSHDLRNPIGGMLGLTELLQMQLEEEDLPAMAESLEFMDQACQSTYSMLNNLLDHSRLETGSIQFKAEATDLVALVDDEITAHRVSALRKQVRLTFDAPRSAPILADQTMLASAFRNLLSNAIKFTPAGKCVTVSIRADDDCWLVQITDQGIGISTDEPISSRQGTAGESGSGLGLSLTRRFLQHHDSSLLLTSEPGSGTTASFRLARH